MQLSSSLPNNESQRDQIWIRSDTHQKIAIVEPQHCLYSSGLPVSLAERKRLIIEEVHALEHALLGNFVLIQSQPNDK